MALYLAARHASTAFQPGNDQLSPAIHVIPSIVWRQRIFLSMYHWSTGSLDVQLMQTKDHFCRKGELFDLPMAFHSAKQCGEMAAVGVDHPFVAPTQALRREGDNEDAGVDSTQQPGSNGPIDLFQTGDRLEE